MGRVSESGGRKREQQSACRGKGAENGAPESPFSATFSHVQRLMRLGIIEHTGR